MQRAPFNDKMQQLEQQREAARNRKRRLQGEEARYTLVLHSTRKALGISINEYCFADTVHKLSSAHSPVPGWCFAAKEQLGDSLALTRQAIHAMIKRLAAKDLIEVQPQTGYLRSTPRWRDTVEVKKAQVFGD